MVLFFTIRKISDAISVKILAPVSFILRGASLFLILTVSNPDSIYSYFIWAVATFLGFLVGIVIDGYYAKNLP